MLLTTWCLGIDQVTPLPVWHDPSYQSLGFRIGDVCYIRYISFLNSFLFIVYLISYGYIKLVAKVINSIYSDASEIPIETYRLLKNCDLLILVPDTSFTGLTLGDSALTCIKLSNFQKYESSIVRHCFLHFLYFSCL